MNILVTGGAGFIGSHLAERLLRRGDRVVVLDCLNDYYDPRIKERNLEGIRRSPKATFVKGDILDVPAPGHLGQAPGSVLLLQY
jgi:UDP-glucuronate 4-epimerase